MKKLFSIFFVTLFLCGCSSLTSNDNIINLLSSPKLNENESEVVQAISEYIGRNVSLKYPKKSGTSTPVNIFDIDSDGYNEAVIFYNAQSIGSNVRIAILEKTADGWNVTYDSEGFGTEIYKIDFERLSKSAKNSIIVGYTFADSSEKMLSIYSVEGKAITKADIYSCQDYITTDITGDGYSDIIMAGNVADNQRANLGIITMTDDEFVTVASDEIDTANARVTNIALTKSEENNKAILFDYYDAYKLVHTEIYTYSDGEIIQLLSGNDVVKEWLPSYNIISTDVDRDGYIETPTIITDSDIGIENIKLMEWTNFSLSQPVRKLYGICETENGVFIALPDEWQDVITVIRENDSYSLVRLSDEKAVATINIYTSRVPSDKNDSRKFVSVGTIQLAFSFDEEVADSQIKYITDNIIYLK